MSATTKLVRDSQPRVMAVTPGRLMCKLGNNMVKDDNLKHWLEWLDSGIKALPGAYQGGRTWPCLCQPEERRCGSRNILSAPGSG